MTYLLGHELNFVFAGRGANVTSRPRRPPVIVAGLSPGPHKVRLDLENPIHQTRDLQTVSFVIPTPGG